MASEKGRAASAPLFAVSAEFASPAALVDGVRRVQPHNFGRIETYSPIPIADLDAILGVRWSLVPAAVGVAALGFVGMMGLCIYATAYDYVFDIGGRPLVSWPAFLVPSLSFAMLVGAMVAYLTMLFTNRLPHLNHPAFNIPGFSRASQDRFFLTIEAAGAPLDLPAIERAMRDLPSRPLALVTVPR